MALRLEWNSKKAQSNKRRHGITFEEATTIFGYPLSITIDDPTHSIDEERFITVGTTINGKLIVVVHTDRDDSIRIISARKATKNERIQYEQG